MSYKELAMDYRNVLQAYIQNIVNADQDAVDAFINKMHLKSIAKKDIVLKEGQQSMDMYFIIKGSMRMYYINDKGVETNVEFGIENWWLGDMSSFLNNSPSKLNIQALEHTEVAIMDRQGMEALLKSHPVFERFFRIIISRHMGKIQERLLKMISANVEQNYLDFIDNYPDIFARVSQHHIASYLGCTPEFLSKIRAKLAYKSH